MALAAVRCTSCGGHDTVVRLAVANDYITAHQFAVRTCRRCGVSFTSPQPADLSPYYPARYRRYTGVTRGLLRALYAWKVGGWARRLPARGRALEVGCGAGWMLNALADRGWRVCGSERTIDGAREAAAATGIPVFVGDLGAVSPTAGFDLVILFQVLEHIGAPSPLLRRCAESLSAGGTLIVAVPNIASWQARLFGADWFHLDVPRHVNHFTPETLREACARAGLRVTRTRTVSFEHDPYGWVQSALNRLGFRQNLLTMMLMGMRVDGVGLGARAAVWLLAALLALPAVCLAAASWAVGAGALMEVWAVRPPKA